MKVSQTIKALFEGEKKETNNRGNELQRAFFPSERYIIDFAEDSKAEGWRQFDTSQDAHYFGFWVNPKTLQALCYAEGDWTLVNCPDTRHYNAEIQDAIDFYDEGFEFKTIGKEGITEYRQDRNEFLIKV